MPPVPIENAVSPGSPSAPAYRNLPSGLTASACGLSMNPSVTHVARPSASLPASLMHPTSVRPPLISARANVLMTPLATPAANRWSPAIAIAWAESALAEGKWPSGQSGRACATQALRSSAWLSAPVVVLRARIAIAPVS